MLLQLNYGIGKKRIGREYINEEKETHQLILDYACYFFFFSLIALRFCWNN